MKTLTANTLQSAIIHSYLASDIIGSEMDYLLSRVNLWSNEEVLAELERSIKAGWEA